MRDLARDVLRHRIVLSYEALAEDLSPDDLLAPILEAVPVPTAPLRERPSGFDGAGLPGAAWGLDMGATAPLSAERLLRRLEWRVVRRLDGRLQGDYRTLFRGSGLDFTDLREYVPGDDLRHIEWNVTARLDEPYVREYVEDRELTAWLLLDHSASMGFGPVDRQKDLVLAEVGDDAGARADPRREPGRRGHHGHRRRRGHPAGVGPQPGAADREDAARPARGPGRCSRAGDPRSADGGPRRGEPPGPPLRAYAVCRVVERRVRSPAPSGAVTDLGALLATAYGIARRRSLVLVVSDFITTDGWEAPLVATGAAARGRGDPGHRPARERAARRGRGLRRGRRDGRADLRRHERRRFPGPAGRGGGRRGRRTSRRRARKAGVDLYPVRTDDDLVRSLMRISELRRRRRR